MATEVFTSYGQQCDSNGVPMSGALVYVYDVGTTAPKSVWTDTALSVAGANPIVCDSSGRHDMRYIATGSYKVVVKTSAGVTVYTRDNIDGRVPVGSGALAIANGGTSATTASAALAALGGATAAEVADIAADVASLVGASGSSEKTHIATGTTAQRPDTPIEGDIRRNTTTAKWEGYDGTDWDNFLNDDDIATQAQMETATSTTTVVPPGRVQYHPGVAKMWALITLTTGTPSIAASHNVTSITDNGVGDFTLNLTTAFSSTTYCAVVSVHGDQAQQYMASVKTRATTSIRVVTKLADGASNNTSATDDINFYVVAWGDQ